MNKRGIGATFVRLILCRHYRCEIAAFDIRTKRCDVYGQEEQYASRCLVLYDGLHYDALSVAAFADAPEEIDCTMFDPAAPDAQQVCKFRLIPIGLLLCTTMNSSPMSRL